MESDGDSSSLMYIADITKSHCLIEHEADKTKDEILLLSHYLQHNTQCLSTVSLLSDLYLSNFLPRHKYNL